ncbi:MAG TPA: acyl-CoA dehydrogenase family protein [Burkholderiaceae bacterium]|nr:acyl-CoA dehydrogenase family protein [Burkholderiaceae bacterium]
MSDSMIEQSAARLFSENVDKGLLEKFETGAFPEELWQLAADSGFPLALADEEGGGIGESWAAAYPILRGIGYWQVPLPLAETMIGAQLLSMAGIEVPEGPIAIVEQGLGNTLSASGNVDSLTLTGELPRVAWARHCRWAVVSLATEGIALVDLQEDESVRIIERTNHAKIPADGLSFDGVRAVARAANPLPQLDRPVWTLGALARSAMIVGALEWLLEQSVQYANDRVQFGKPIGKNQALQQQLALMAGDVAAARMAVLVAMNDAPSANARDCSSTLFSTSVAKIRSGEAATRATSIAHQVHGAIGFTYEHMLNFGTRRLWAWREEFGSDSWWAERLGQAAIEARSSGFWPSLTQRRFDRGIRTA